MFFPLFQVLQTCLPTSWTWVTPFQSAGSPTGPHYNGKQNWNRKSSLCLTMASSGTLPHLGLAQSKKNGDIRLCVDFWALNKVTAPDNYPLPRIDDLLATVSKAKYLTTLDLTKGYHQIALEPSTIPKTAFTSHCRKYEYLRLPFGLCNAPAYFQRCMDATFADISARAYIDDIKIATEIWQEHLSVLSTVLHRCREKKISLKLAKCFTSAKLDYLGHNIDPTPSCRRQPRWMPFLISLSPRPGNR